MPPRAAAIVLAVAALFPGRSFAQPSQSSAPGPYVIDVRGAMSGAPAGISFYPPVPSDTVAPQRAFGLGAGAHLYPFQLGPARVGIGVDLMRARGTARVAAATASTAATSTTTSAVDAAMTVTTVAPQLSFNFGTHEGWSYLSGGYGTTETRAEVTIAPGSGSTGSGTATRERRTYTINFGGGARWFLREHMAVGFDVRFHRLRSTLGHPSKQTVGLSVGLSLR